MKYEQFPQQLEEQYRAATKEERMLDKMFYTFILSHLVIDPQRALTLLEEKCANPRMDRAVWQRTKRLIAHLKNVDELRGNTNNATEA